MPNTDVARVRAIESALEKGKRTPIANLAFGYPTLERLQAVYPKLLSSIRHLETIKQNQFNKSHEYGEIVKRARMYLNHFVQVLSLAIIREELKPEARLDYGLDINPKNIPSMSLEQEIIEWGEKIIGGEQLRCKKGGNPIYSPSIALVKVHYDCFTDAYREQKLFENLIARASAQMEETRNEVDKIIQQTWNEIESYFGHLPDEQMRENAATYGVVYVWRSTEKQPEKQSPESE